MEPLRSEPFTIPRYLLARMTAEAYVRQFWWFILPGPLFGIVVLVLARDPILQAVGGLGCVWPLTIPFRAYIITAKLGGRLIKPTTVTAVEEGLLFDSDKYKFRISYSNLRNARILHKMVVLGTKRFGVLLVPVWAFPRDEVGDFLQALRQHGVRVNQKSFLEI